MKSNSFKYILRCAIQPGHHEEERIEEMISFCKEAKIDDVMFFINCEEINTGHLTFEATTPWMQLIASCKQQLNPLDITTSINPWITTMHADRGRKLREGQDFILMVDTTGKQAEATVCPLCPEWRKYISDMYAYYATIHPDMIWVEDDFRLHNHAPLSWGGCFCDLHMKEYSKRAGKQLEREEFIQGVLKPGEPHPYRKIWLDCGRDAMFSLAKEIGAAVHKVSPETKVGLMSSMPSVHCAEGRDWEGILKGLAGENPMVNRPHLPAYGDTSPQYYHWNFNTISRLSKAVVPETTEIYPELEDFPHSRFSKSKSFVTYQVITSSILDSCGITLNIFDMAGNGVMRSEGYQKSLADIKAFANRVRDLGLKTVNQTGVKVLVDPCSSYTLQTHAGEAMPELYPEETFWGGLLSSYGIANAYSAEKIHRDQVVAISGQYFRNLKSGEIERLFNENIILMDGEATYTLFDMELGKLAGIRSATWLQQDSGAFAYEEVCNGLTYCGIKQARISSQGSSGDFLNIQYIEKPELVTMVKNPFGENAGPGVAVYEGRVIMWPYGRYISGNQVHMYPVRQEILQQILLKLLKEQCPVFVKGDPNIGVYTYALAGRQAIMLVNASGDDLEKVRLVAPGFKPEGSDEINRDYSNAVRGSLIRDGEDLVLESGLRNLELKIILQQ